MNGCYGMSKAIVAIFIFAIAISAIVSCSLVIQSLRNERKCVLASEEMSTAAASGSFRYFKVSAEQVAEQMRLDWDILALHMAFSEYGILLQKALAKTPLDECHTFCESAYAGANAGVNTNIISTDLDPTRLDDCFHVCNQCHEPKDKWPKSLNCSRLIQLMAMLTPEL